MQNLRHRRARNIGALLGQTALGKISSCMLGVGEVDIGDDVNDSSVCLLGEALVLASVACLHMEDGNMESLCRDGGEAGVGVAKDQKRIGLAGNHQLVGAVDDVTNRCAEIIANSIHINLGRIKREVLEEYAVEVVVVVLPGVGENAVKILSALVYDGGKPDYLGACANDDKQL